MDAPKLTGLNKARNIHNPPNAKKSGTKLTEDDLKTVMELKKLHLETIKLDVELQKDIYNMEKEFENRHNAIFDKRQEILEKIRKATGDGENNQSSLGLYWLKVLKSSYTEFISKNDEQILVHLVDIRNRLYNDPQVMFVLEFYFEPNEFFSNSVLTKTYFLNCLPDPEDPFSYDGAEIYKCEGCEIDWKINPNNDTEKGKKSNSSFFDFFSPPELPINTANPNYYDINATLQNDFELGFYLKERVIPKSIMFFTGEIADCQSDSESESSEAEGEGEDEDNQIDRDDN